MRRYPSFPIVLETYRQALGDVFDLGALKSVLRQVQDGRIRIDEVETQNASPIARSLVFAYVAAYIYEIDQPLAERRAQALTRDQHLLAELLGQAELRELLDAEVMENVQGELQALTPSRQVGDADELLDLLRRIGDLSQAEIEARSRRSPTLWIEQLTGELRIVRVQLADEQRFIAAEEAGLYRDALGVMPPAGLPDACLRPVEGAFERLLRRFARNSTPFTSDLPAARYGLTSS